jgi:hypothetical protein
MTPSFIARLPGASAAPTISSITFVAGPVVAIGEARAAGVEDVHRGARGVHRRQQLLAEVQRDGQVLVHGVDVAAGALELRSMIFSSAVLTIAAAAELVENTSRKAWPGDAGLGGQRRGLEGGGEGRADQRLQAGLDGLAHRPRRRRRGGCFETASITGAQASSSPHQGAGGHHGQRAALRAGEAAGDRAVDQVDARSPPARRRSRAPRAGLMVAVRIIR